MSFKEKVSSNTQNILNTARAQKQKFDTQHDTSRGRYVNNHQYLDIHKPGLRRINSRMRDIYDQSRQEAISTNYSGRPTPTTLMLAGGAAMAGLLLYFMVLPKLAQNPFLYLLLYMFAGPVTFKFILNGIFFGAICFGAVLGYFFLLSEQNSAGAKSAKVMNQYDYNDAYIANPPELPMHYDVFPDVKVHADIDVTALLSHEMILDTASVHGKDGNVKFDNNFSQQLFDLASLPKTNPPRKLFNPAKMLYNPDHKYGKIPVKTVLDLINQHWFVPDYEKDSQDPAGMFIVSTGPENTIVCAQTRGGKGQKYINNIIDIWSRQTKLPNMVLTDLKMELLEMNLKMLTIRGYNVKSLNLMNSDKTDAVNYLLYAAEAGVKGNVTQMETITAQISDIFFGNDSKSGQDPFWNNSASAAFKRVIYILIDYYSEYIHRLKNNPMLSQSEIARRTDEAWGHVTLFNAYKFMTEASSKTFPQDVYKEIYPVVNGHSTDSDPEATTKSGMTIYADATDVLPQNPIREKIANLDKLIRSVSPSEKTLSNIYGICLTGMIFFTDDAIVNLTSARPSNNLDMAGFSFPRRIGIRFNRRFAKKHGYFNAQVVWQVFHDPAMQKPYLKEVNGQKVLDSRYFSEGGVNRYGWATGYFEGKFTDNVSYIKASIYDPTLWVSHKPDANGHIKHSDNLLIGEYDFIFTKDYRKSYAGSNYLINLINGEREVQNGTLEEYTYHPILHKINRSRSSETRKEYNLIIGNDKLQDVRYFNIQDTTVHYADKPIVLSLVAPPTTGSYNKILLITIDMLASQQQTLANTVTNDQKPYTVTKYLLDEFGNMQSEGKGVPQMGEKLSAGLSAGQQFTLILQSMKQLEAIYGEAMSHTMSSNVTSFVFLKSKDKSLIDFLMDMNGKKHEVQITNESFTHPVGGFHMYPTSKQGQDTHPQITETRGHEEKPVISENDYLRLNDDPADGNMIVTNGSDPIWSANETVIPMSGELLENRTGGLGKAYNASNLPTLANTMEFNALANIPDVTKMIARRMEEAKWATKVIAEYKRVTKKTDHDINMMDAEEYSDIIMRGIYANIDYKNHENAHLPIDPFNQENDYKRDEAESMKSKDEQKKDTADAITKLNDISSNLAKAQTQVASVVANDVRTYQSDDGDDTINKAAKYMNSRVQKNTNLTYDERKMQSLLEANSKPVYAGKQLSVSSFVQAVANRPFNASNATIVGASLKPVLANAYDSMTQQFKDHQDFEVSTANGQGGNGKQNLYHIENGQRVLFIQDNGLSNGETAEASDRYVIKDAFIYFLVNQTSWLNNPKLPSDFDTAVERWLSQSNQPQK